MLGISLVVLKIVFLFIAVRYTFVNIGKLMYRQPVSSENTFNMTIGIVGFIVIQFELWKF